MKEESIENKQLILIPKIEDYIEYMINVILPVLALLLHGMAMM